MPRRKPALRISIALLLLMLLAVSLVSSLILAANEPRQRQLAIPYGELVAVELASVGIVPLTGSPVVLLREPEQGRVVPIFIGPNEARAIVQAQRGLAMPRPMTHDLMANILTQLDGELQSVVVDRLDNGTYYGALVIRGRRNRQIVIDSRPSDAMALAVRLSAPIKVAPDILESSADIPFEGLGGDDEVVTALGITVTVASAELRQALELPDRNGVLVNSVQGMAALGELRPGALITHVNDQAVVSPLGFLEQINAIEDREAVIRFWLDGQEYSVTLDTTVPGQPRRPDQRRAI